MAQAYPLQALLDVRHFREEAARCGISTADVPSGEGMFVSPRGIDEIVACASDILSSAVNRTFGISFS